MGWRAAGDAALSSPWPAPWWLPELLPAGLGGKPAAQENPGAAQAVAGGRMEEANPTVGFQGSVVSPALSAVSRVLWDVPSANTPASALPPNIRCQPFLPLHLLNILDTQQFLWPPHCNVVGISGGVSSHLLQNGAFSFPYGHRGKEIITRGLLRLGWSQLTQEDEELTSHWALPLLVPFLEQTFHGAGQGKADWGLGFFPFPRTAQTHTKSSCTQRS